MMKVNELQPAQTSIANNGFKKKILTAFAVRTSYIIDYYFSTSEYYPFLDPFSFSNLANSSAFNTSPVIFNSKGWSTPATFT